METAKSESTQASSPETETKPKTKVQKAPMGIGNTNRIIIDKELDCILGIAGNNTRVPAGIVKAKCKSHVVECVLSSGIFLESENEEYAKNRQAKLEGLKEGLEYYIFQKLSDDYDIPLSFTGKVKGNIEEKIDKFCAKSWLAPIALTAFANEQLTLDQPDSLQLPGTGFLYLFMDGYLWREIAITTDEAGENYTLEEVNLKADWAKSKRESRIPLNDDVILVPQGISGEQSELSIAHSFVQWSWNQIAAYGGLHAEDPRVVDEQPKASRLKNSLHKDRLQKLPALLPWMPVEGKHGANYFQTTDSSHKNYHIPTVPLFNPVSIATKLAMACVDAFTKLKKEYDKLPDRFPHYASAELIHRFAYDPTVYERAKAGYDIEGTANEARKVLGGKLPRGSRDGKSFGKFRSYLQKTYADENVRAKKLSELYSAVFEQSLGRETDYKRTDNTAAFIRSVAENLDEQALNSTLFPTEIHDAIKELEETRKIYFAWMDERSGERKIKDCVFDDVRLHAVLADFSNLDPEDEENSPLYLYQVWLLLAFPCHSKKTTVSDLYEQMERRSPKIQREPDVGQQWLDRLVDNTSHPLHKILFPPASIDITRPYQAADELPDVDFDGSGAFRPKAFAMAVGLLEQKAEAAQPQNAQASIVDSQTDAAHSAVGPELMGQEQKELALSLRLVEDFFGWMNALLDKESADYAKTSQPHELFIRTGQAAQLKDLKGIHLIKKGNEVNTQKFIVLGANNIRLQELAGKQNNQARVDQFKKEAAGSPYVIDVIDATTGKTIGSNLMSQTRQWHKGAAPPIPGDAFDAEKLWSQSPTYARGKLLSRLTADFDVLVVDVNSRWSASRANLAIANNAHQFDIPTDAINAKASAAVFGTRTGHAGLSAAMLYYEIMTLKSILSGSLNDQSSSKKFMAIIVAMFSLVASLGEATSSIATFVGKHKLAESLNDLTFKKGKLGKLRVDLRVFRTLGAAVSGVTSVLSAIDAFESFKRNDHDAAAALAVGALTGAALTAVGVGSLAKLGWLSAIPNPVVWGLIGLSIAAAMAAAYFRDKPLQDWAKFGPFGQHAYQGDYRAWQNSPEQCYQALIGQLIQPTLALKEGEDPETAERVIIATLDCSTFNLQEDQVLLQVNASYKPLMQNQGAYNVGLPVYGSLPQKPRPPYKIVQEQRNGGALFHYLFKIPQKNAAADLIQWHARARANINGAALPYPYKPNAFAGKPSSNDVIEDDIDWITAQPITTK